jgi:lipoate-protein ligase A
VLWTLIVESSGRTGSENMSIDHSLLHSVREGVGFLRLYSWSPPCISFGRNEPALLRYDKAEIARLGLDTVRRPTGGRAVWHDAEVTYAVAAPVTTFGSLRETYNIIHRTLAAALQSSAQVREGSAFLQHGSILLEDGQDVVARVTKGERVDPVATSIGRLLDRSVTSADVARAIAGEACWSWAGVWETGVAPTMDFSMERFADPAWTWRR